MDAAFVPGNLLLPRKRISRLSRPNLTNHPHIVPRMSSFPLPTSTSRRAILQAITLTLPTALFPISPALSQSQFTTYKGPLSLGFSFTYPSNWRVKKKPIKTHLSEVIVTSDQDSTTSAGLVVDAVKIDSIEKFGTPQVVGKKVVDMELKKDSVSNASLLEATSIRNGPLVYYLIDYSVDSSRGVKRYLAKATIAANQLYVFTAQAKADSFEGETKDLVSEMVDSFTVNTTYL